MEFGYPTYEPPSRSRQLAQAVWDRRYYIAFAGVAGAITWILVGPGGFRLLGADKDDSDEGVEMVEKDGGSSDESGEIAPQKAEQGVSYEEADKREKEGVPRSGREMAQEDGVGMGFESFCRWWIGKPQKGSVAVEADLRRPVAAGDHEDTAPFNSWGSRRRRKVAADHEDGDDDDDDVEDQAEDKKGSGGFGSVVDSLCRWYVGSD